MHDLKFYICFFIEKITFGNDDYDKRQPNVEWDTIFKEFRATKEEIKAAIEELKEDRVVVSYDDYAVVFNARIMSEYAKELDR
jgi:hypothetical protein